MGSSLGWISLLVLLQVDPSGHIDKINSQHAPRSYAADPEDVPRPELVQW